VDASSGTRLWAFETGAPLVSVSHGETSSTASSSYAMGDTQGGGGGAGGGGSAAHPVNVFPGVDGGLYAYHGLTQDGEAQLEVAATGALGDSGRVRWQGVEVWVVLAWASSLSSTGTIQVPWWRVHALLFVIPTGALVCGASIAVVEKGRRRRECSLPAHGQASSPLARHTSRTWCWLWLQCNQRAQRCMLKPMRCAAHVLCRACLAPPRPAPH
jgi:hypothetical protein